MKHVLLTASLVLAACSSSKFNTSVAGFGETSTRALDAFEKSLDTQQTALANDRRDALAEARTELFLSTGCTTNFADPTAPASDCFVADKQNERVTLQTDLATLRRISAGIKSYSANIAILAGSADEDLKVYRDAVNGLATAIGTLEVELASLDGEERDANPKFGAIGNIAGQIGSLILEQQRANALSDIVIATDPTVQAATALLGEAELQLVDDEKSRVFDAANTATADLGKAISAGAPTKTIAQKQAAVFNAQEAYLAIARRPLATPEVGKAHAGLVSLARGNPSLADLNVALGKLVVATQSIEASLDDL